MYPGLEKLFDESSWRACPTIVSLGDKGYYYVRVGTQWKYSLPRTITDDVKDWEGVRRLWLGCDDAYVLERFDGTYSRNLEEKPRAAYYEKMVVHLRDGVNGCKTIKVCFHDPVVDHPR